MFRKFFNYIKKKLFNTSKKDIPTAAHTQKITMPAAKAKPKVHVSRKGRRYHFHQTNIQHRPGYTRRPPTFMESPDNQMTQMKTQALVPQKRSHRNEIFQKNGRYYHRPWPFERKTA